MTNDESFPSKIVEVDPKRVTKLVLCQEWEGKTPHVHCTIQEPGLGVWDAETDCLFFACPGCGKVGAVRVGMKEKPARSPSWQLMEGDPVNPSSWSLMPSIHCIGCCGWHGWLTKGVFCFDHYKAVS